MDKACDERGRERYPERSRRNCPVKKEAEETAKLGNEMLKRMRRLRKHFRYCHRCVDYDGCPVLAEFSAAVDQALLELYEEWNLK